MKSPHADAPGTDRYAAGRWAAAYVAASWGDVLFRDAGPHQLDPWRATAATFYRDAVDLARGLLPDRPLRSLDAGCGMGRASKELSRLAGGLDLCVLVDESATMLAFAEALLLNPSALESVPRLTDAGQTWQVPDALPDPIRAARVLVERATVEDLAHPAGTFDVVLCFGVPDRVRSPSKLFSRLRHVLADGGLVIAASPLDWRACFTPRSARVRSLTDLMQKGWMVERTADLVWRLPRSTRKVVDYLVEAVVARKVR